MGIPDTIVTDNGPQLVSDEFGRFSQKWGFEHLPSSPYHSRSNGKAESSLKAAKNMIKKARRDGEDQYLALLNIRNTPTQGMNSSPAQRLLGRRTKTTVPTTHTLLQPSTTSQHQTSQMLKQSQDRQAKYYNRSSKDLPSLQEGETRHQIVEESNSRGSPRPAFVPSGGQRWKRLSMKPCTPK